MREMPPILAGDAKQQIAQLRDYLVRLERERDVEIVDTVSREAAGTKGTSSAPKGGTFPVRGEGSAGGDADATRAAQLRALIVKTAEDSRNRDNVISSSHGASIVVKGEGNVLMNNIVDGDVIVEGGGNTVSGLVFTTPGARLILRGEGNRVWGVPPERIDAAHA